MALDALFCLLAFRAVGVTVPVLVVLYGYTLFNLSFILPSPPGQVGSNELIGLLIFSGVFRVSRAGVGAMFLFSHPWTGAPHDVHRPGLPERDEPDPAQHVPPRPGQQDGARTSTEPG